MDHIIQLLKYFVAVSDPQASDHSAREFHMDSNYVLKDTQKIYYVHSTQNLVVDLCNEYSMYCPPQI